MLIRILYTFLNRRINIMMDHSYNKKPNESMVYLVYINYIYIYMHLFIYIYIYIYS